MKDFVFSTKSASSPPYPSPDSISSDSSINSKCLSDSPAVSPSVICADLTSSTPSNSSVSVLPPKISPLSISKTSKYINVNFASQNSSQSAPALSKKFPLSIAERRGLGKDASRAVYVWVGKSFCCDFSKVRQVDCKGPGDPGEIDWKQSASVVLHQMVLPIDSNIKDVTDASLGNSPSQKCKLRLCTIGPCGRTLP
ncbi:hypothetical protein BC332_14251 [Capsicum chinense]|nr:hypothetical protein BC332_14251 [Capsicum chinense]